MKTIGLLLIAFLANLDDLSILTRVNIGMSSLSQVLRINLIRIQPNKSSSQTYNVKIFPRRPKALHLGWGTEQKPWIREFCLDSKENSC